MISRGRDGYFHPASADEVRGLVLEARTRGLKLRVRGSGHSVAPSIHATGAFPPRIEAGGMDVMLDRMRSVLITPEADREQAVVEVEAGCNLGLDPYDPSGTSTWENSLNVQLHRAGWALGSMGGISHQTVAGFLMTGSAGGSTRHNLAAAVLRLQLVDGNGDMHELSGSDTGAARRLFEAAGVSMGLLGVITKVWLRVGRAYDLIGREVTTPAAECAVDVFGAAHDHRPSLADLFRSAPHSRVLWWPQHRFDRIQIWSAEPAPQISSRGTPFEILSQWQSLSGSLLQTVVGNLPDLAQVRTRLEGLRWFSHLERAVAGVRLIDELRPTSTAGSVGRDAGRWRRIYARGVRRVAESAVRGAFGNTLAKRAGRTLTRRMPNRIHRLMTRYLQDGTKEFRDRWHVVMPMDDNLDVQLWPTSFCELWFPLEAAPAVLKRLREIHAVESASRRYELSRAFPVEIYASPPSPFWLSPAYERESLRINVVWLDQWPGDPARDLYPVYYEALKEFGFRPHWGKYLPAPDDEWRAYYRRNCPQLQAFLDLRGRLDPGQVFVNEYWRNHLGIPS